MEIFILKFINCLLNYKNYLSVKWLIKVISLLICRKRKFYFFFRHFCQAADVGGSGIIQPSGIRDESLPL